MTKLGLGQELITQFSPSPHPSASLHSILVRSPNTTALKIIPLIYFILTKAMYNGIMQENIRISDSIAKRLL